MMRALADLKRSSEAAHWQSMEPHPILHQEDSTTRYQPHYLLPIVQNRSHHYPLRRSRKHS
jgi:hypothetical protein